MTFQHLAIDIGIGVILAALTIADITLISWIFTWLTS